MTAKPFFQGVPEPPFSFAGDPRPDPPLSFVADPVVPGACQGATGKHRKNLEACQGLLAY